MVKNPPANAGDTGFTSGLERSPGGGNGNPFQHSCLGKSHGQKEPGRLQFMGLQKRHDLATKQQQAKIISFQHAIKKMIYIFPFLHNKCSKHGLLKNFSTLQVLNSHMWPVSVLLDTAFPATDHSQFKILHCFFSFIFY